MVRFLLYDVEMISSHRIILFTCIKNRGVEIFNIDRIRFNLRFQTESIPLIVSMTIFTMFIFDKICCVKLYTWTVRSDIHGNSGFITVCGCDQSSVSFCIIVCHIIVVISACEFQLVKFCLISCPIFLAVLKSMGVPATSPYTPVGME